MAVSVSIVPVEGCDCLELTPRRMCRQSPRRRRRARSRHRLGGRRAAAGLVCAAVTLLALVGPASAEDYVVQSGDSLSVIARDHGVGTAELASANAISDLHLIRVGQVLSIPRSEPAYYLVRSGDSLSVIARDHGVGTDELAASNGISDRHLIRVGQRLKIPSGATIAPVDPAAGYNSLPGRLRDNPKRLELIPVFEQWADHYGVPRDLLMAMAYRESGWQNEVVSHKGAVGIGQLMPATSAWVANDLIKVDLDPTVPTDNIRMSARLVQWLIGFMGGETQAIAGYYQGPGSVASKGLYDDTQAYINNVAQIRPLFAKG